MLIVDEVGYMRLEHADANRFFQLISRRYTRSSMIVTSNRRVSEWAGLFGDEVQAVAILDRLLHDAAVLTINGPSWRLRGRGDLLADNGKTAPTAKTARPIPLGTLAEGHRRAHTTPTEHQRPRNYDAGMVKRPRRLNRTEIETLLALDVPAHPPPSIATASRTSHRSGSSGKTARST